MKRFAYVLGMLAVLIACAPVTAHAVRPKQEVAPVQPPGQIGDDDQPGKEIEGEQPAMKASNPAQSPAPVDSQEASVERGRWVIRVVEWVQSLLKSSRSVRHP